jgi:hypothetical protein
MTANHTKWTARGRIPCTIRVSEYFNIVIDLSISNT